MAKTMRKELDLGGPCFYLFIFCCCLLWATHSGAEGRGLFLALYSGISPNRAGGNLRDVGIEPRSVACKSNVLPSVHKFHG